MTSIKRLTKAACSAGVMEPAISQVAEGMGKWSRRCTVGNNVFAVSRVALIPTNRPSYYMNWETPAGTLRSGPAYPAFAVQLAQGI